MREKCSYCGSAYCLFMTGQYTDCGVDEEAIRYEGNFEIVLLGGHHFYRRKNTEGNWEWLWNKPEGEDGEIVYE